MKVWNRPEMKVFGVKLDENIASSSVGVVYQSGTIFFGETSDIIFRDYGTYRFTEDRRIEDTNITYTEQSRPGRLVSLKYKGEISGCQVN